MVPAIRIRSLADARLVLGVARELGRRVTLTSTPGAAGFGGPLLWAQLINAARAEFPEVAFDDVLDCADAPGDAMAALRCRVARLSFSGRADVAAKLREMARAVGAELLDALPPSLDLEGLADPRAACVVWLREERVHG